ncbi:arginase family protein [Arenibaculum pallidiluteum]|uniref:arginase family protein n=1 Tax=Arenibaculum pallidiluteum TaxID=2812559 RepID=UPI001A973730|nr:arginase family protein [Arenibaculum pallidiluteum]
MEPKHGRDDPDGDAAPSAAGVTVVLAPYHAGRRECRVGRGPGHLMRAGLAEALRARGARVEIVEIPPVEEHEGEIGRSFAVKRHVAAVVSAARAARRFPLVLAGNCNASVGVHAGLGDPGTGVVWFDAHPDFDTPDEHLSGYFDGMGVATLAGQCWRRLAATIPGFRPLDPRRLVYCGIRDFEPGQREKVEAHGIRAVLGATPTSTLAAGQRPDFAGGLRAALHGTDRARLHIHLDLDCLDTAVGQANAYAAPGGLGTEDLMACLGVVRGHAPVAAMTIASFEPGLPGSDAIAAAAIGAALAIVPAAVRAS